MLDEAEGTQLEPKKLHDKDTFQQGVFEVIFWDPHSSIYKKLLITCTKKINQGKCQNATKGW